MKKNADIRSKLHMVGKRSLAVILAAVLFCGCFVMPVQADETTDYIHQMEERERETQAAISNLERQQAETRAAISNLEGQKAEAEQNVSSLQNKAAGLTSTYQEYSRQMDDINAEIDVAQTALAETSGQIIEVNNHLEETRRQEREQYEALKKQIKNTYENSHNDTLIMALLSCFSIQDLLTRAEYINAVVAYDQKMLKKYRELEAQIEEEAAVLEEKQDELDSYQATLDEKQGELEELTDSVQSALSDTNSNISSEKNKLANYAEQLASLDKKMKELESQTAAAQAALAQQIAERQAAQIAAGLKENTGGSYAASASELEWLAATIQAEADGESYTGKLAVGSVIMNRVKSSSFPNSIVGVITQNLQFASYRSGKVELIISRGPNSTCLQAAQEVIGGARVGDYLFFMTKHWVDYYGIAEYTMIGNHAFFYRWIVNKPEPAPEPEPEPEAPPAEEPPQEEPDDSDDYEESYDDEE